MVLYQPTQQEIDEAVAKVRVNFPALADRMYRATKYLADVSVWGGWMDKETIWALPSQSQPGQEYFVENGTRCTCEDYRSHKALADGQPVCKHTLAVRAYKYIVARKLQVHLSSGGIKMGSLGRGQYRAERRWSEFRVWRKVEYRQAGFGIGEETGSFRFKSDWDLQLYAEQLAKAPVAPVAVVLPQMQMAAAAD